MKVYTSNFARHGKNPRFVSIAAMPPEWYEGKECLAFAPPMALVRAYQRHHRNSPVGISEAEYTEIYEALLDRMAIELELFKLEEMFGPEIILGCHCPRGEFCHRKILARRIESEMDWKVVEL